jgi:hypothetical protein
MGCPRADGPSQAIDIDHGKAKAELAAAGTPLNDAAGVGHTSSRELPAHAIHLDIDVGGLEVEATSELLDVGPALLADRHLGGAVAKAQAAELEQHGVMRARAKLEAQPSEPEGDDDEFLVEAVANVDANPGRIVAWSRNEGRRSNDVGGVFGGHAL